MRRFALGVAGVCLVASGGSPAVAQAPPQKWQLATDNGWCKISTGDPHSGYLMFQLTPGSGETRLTIVGPTAAIRTSRGVDSEAEVTLRAGSFSFTSEAERFPGGIGGTSVLRVHRSPSEFADMLANASELRVEGLPGPLAVPTRGAAVAARGLAKCEEDMLRQWGLDPTAYHALRAFPYPASEAWMRAIDYPNSAAENAKEGGVVVRVDVDPSGKPTNCAAVASSGYAPIDRITCERAMGAKYQPAIGADGQPTAGSQVLRVTFEIEDF